MAVLVTVLVGGYWALVALVVINVVASLTLLWGTLIKPRHLQLNSAFDRFPQMAK